MTCAAGDLDCRLDSIISTLQAGPDGWTKAAVIVAAVGVVASTAVAIVAYLASKRAVTIAQGSDDREAKRDEERQRERVDRWLAEFIGAATTYWTDCDAWTKEHKNREYRIRMGARDDDGPAPTPRAAPMLSSLDSARLVSRGDDQLRLRQVSEAVVALRNISIARRGGVMEALTIGVRDWRSGTINGPELELRITAAVTAAQLNLEPHDDTTP